MDECFKWEVKGHPSQIWEDSVAESIVSFEGPAQ